MSFAATMHMDITERLRISIAELGDRIQRRRVYRITVTELRKLPDTRLDDLGITRSMIERVAYQTAFKN